MHDSLANIREANKERTASDLALKRHQEQLNSNQAMQRAIFEAFQSMTGALKGDTTKAEAISHIFKVLEDIDDKYKASHTDVELLKSGLNTLEKQLSEVPVGDLKQLPKFLQQRDSVKVSNLDDLKQYLEDVVKAVKALDLNVKAPDVNVEAPQVHVKAPIVNVDAPDLKPIQTGLEAVVRATKANKLVGDTETKQVNTLITERFDEYRLSYTTDDFEEDAEPVISAITYFNKGKQVAKIKYTYKSGKLATAKRAK